MINFLKDKIDREKYEKIAGKEFHSGIVEVAKNNGWSPWE
tara:strand:+ start:233 stop:352 length:120 start_codon:yes stop_codon:yes gene_type:complete